MSKDNKIIKNAVFHIKYPYTALIIAAMWISIALIISFQKQADFEILVIATSICTLIIAVTGLRAPK